MKFSRSYDPLRNFALKNSVGKKVFIKDRESGAVKYGVLTKYNQKTGEYYVKTIGDLNPQGRKFKVNKLARLVSSLF
jgi:ferredoxin-fold anticodon binding domain-containing protein